MPKKTQQQGLRIDAQRNEDAILVASKKIFLSEGVDAPVRTIATEAGVGLGTLYRRFPKRSDLIVAVFCKEVDDCADFGKKILGKEDAVSALTAWLLRYSDFIRTKRGLSAALHSGDPAFDELPRYFREKFEPVLDNLLQNAATQQKIRTDIKAYDLLKAVGKLSTATSDEESEESHLMVRLLIDGLQHMSQ